MLGDLVFYYFKVFLVFTNKSYKSATISEQISKYKNNIYFVYVTPVPIYPACPAYRVCAARCTLFIFGEKSATV